jgi:TRAP-type mannitol/chloroaromatic compound transport system permease small subunit
MLRIKNAKISRSSQQLLAAYFWAFIPEGIGMFQLRGIFFVIKHVTIINFALVFGNYL